MSALRIVGGIFAAAFFALAWFRYSRRRISRLNLIISSLISAVLLLLAIAPGLFNPLFEVFNFQPGSGQRLTAVLLFAVAILFVLLIRVQSEVDTNERNIRTARRIVRTGGLRLGRGRRPPAGQADRRGLSRLQRGRERRRRHRGDAPEVEGYHVIPIVIDDRSDDGTADAARAAGGLAASLPIRRGGGLALRVGYDIALTLEADIVVTMDADGQHQPEELPTVVGPIIDGRADHVNGSRMLGDFERESLIRHLGVHFFSRVVTILTGQRVTDISSGYRATRADTLQRLILEQDQFWTSEVTIEALRQRARVVEVPVTFLTRRGGCLEEAEVVPLRLELLEGDRQDLAALAAATSPARRALDSSSARFASRLSPSVRSDRHESRNGVIALPRTPSRSAIRSHALTASSTTPGSIAKASGTGLHRSTAATASSSPSARSMRAASPGVVHPVVEVHRGLARQEERQTPAGVAQHPDAELLEPLRGGDRVDDRFRTGAHEQDRCSGELDQVSGYVPAPRMHAPDAAGRPDHDPCPVRRPDRARDRGGAQVTRGDRHGQIASGDLGGAAGLGEHRSSSAESPTTTSPSITPIHAGTAPAERIAALIRSTHSRLRGGGSPWETTLVSSATTPSPAVSAAATSLEGRTALSAAASPRSPPPRRTVGVRARSRSSRRRERPLGTPRPARRRANVRRRAMPGARR